MASFIPAAKFHVCTPLFDLGCSLLGLGKRYRQKIIAALPLPNKKGSVLDAGCGSGSLAIEFKKRYPNIELYGVDADLAILSLAQKKAHKNKVALHLQQGYLQRLPFPDGFFDAVYSSLVLHHLRTEEKEKAFREICRVLKKKGRFLLADFGKPNHPIAAPLSWFTVLLEEGKDNYQGKIPVMMQNAGFTKIRRVAEHRYNVHILRAEK